MSDLRHDATQIWHAGVDAVRPTPLLRRTLRIEQDHLWIEECCWSRESFDRLIVVGAGKAGTAMAAGVAEAIGDWIDTLGWINVPAGTERDLGSIRVHAARPAGVNEPTQQGVEGTLEMLRLVREAGPRDLVMALISGGGSALMPAPKEGLSLQDKVDVTRYLSGAGADITELNVVRKHLSSVKGGGLLRQCRAGQLITLVLSDVLGDPIDLIASGPTVPDSSSPGDALRVLEQFDPKRALPSRIYQVLERSDQRPEEPADCPHTTFVIGNNALAVDSAGLRAEQLGYNHAMHSANQCEGAAEQVGRHLAEMTLQMLASGASGHRSDCLITGGEPTVTLAPVDRRGRGGRNQQLILAAYQHLLSNDLEPATWGRLCLLSGGTDGEDGPTDAAGAVLDAEIHRRIQSQDLDVDDHLRRNDAYTLFERVGGLLITGPTGTNVCDVRVALIDDDRS